MASRLHTTRLPKNSLSTKTTGSISGSEALFPVMISAVFLFLAIILLAALLPGIGMSAGGLAQLAAGLFIKRPQTD